SALTGYEVESLQPIIDRLLSFAFLVQDRDQFFIVHDLIVSIARRRHDDLREMTRQLLHDLPQEERAVLEILFGIAGGRPATLAEA
ncbi:MAG: hypothetical protein WBF13_04220, partial [Candidatus Zixiibacteriota bacterium]